MLAAESPVPWEHSPGCPGSKSGVEDGDVPALATHACHGNGSGSATHTVVSCCVLAVYGALPLSPFSGGGSHVLWHPAPTLPPDTHGKEWSWHPDRPAMGKGT